MTGTRTIRRLTLVGLALTATACGGAATAAVQAPAVSWYPSTPLPSPLPPGPTPSASATAAAPAGVGQAINTGLGTPAQNVAATAQLSFSPGTISVKTGDVIQWKNTGSIAHNVTFDSQPSLSSGTLQQGDTWQVQFTTPGTYQYHCTFHPGMNGQITVGG